MVLEDVEDDAEREGGESKASAVESKAPSDYTGTERILALSDGVFAVAITLLVLDLLPSLSTPSQSVGAFMHNKAPSYVSYVLSFLIVGITWTNHHQMFTQIKRSNHVFLLLNIVFLMWLAVLPFPAALLAQYLGSTHVVGTLLGRYPVADRNIAVAIYAAAYVLGSILFNVLWWYGIYKGRLMGDDANHEVVRRTTWSYYVGPVAYLIDVGLALVSVEAGLVLFLALAVFYALAPLPGMSRLMAPKRAHV